MVVGLCLCAHYNYISYLRTLICKKKNDTKLLFSACFYQVDSVFVISLLLVWDSSDYVLYCLKSDFLERVEDWKSYLPLKAWQLETAFTGFQTSSCHCNVMPAVWHSTSETDPLLRNWALMQSGPMVVHTSWDRWVNLQEFDLLVQNLWHTHNRNEKHLFSLAAGCKKKKNWLCSSRGGEMR